MKKWTSESKPKKKQVTKVKFLKEVEFEVSNEKLPVDEGQLKLSLYECCSCHWRFYSDIVRFGHGHNSEYKKRPDFCPGCGRKIED